MKVVIIGAGLSGLAAATWLKEAGHQVQVFEQSKNIGGRAVTIQRRNSDDIVDVGTQYFHSNYKRAIRLLKDAGLDKNLYKIKGKTRFFDTRVKGGTFTTNHRVPYIRSGSFYQNFKIVLKGLMRLARHPLDPYAVLQKSSIDAVPVREVIQDPFEWEYTVRALIAVGALTEPEAQEISYLHLIRLMRIILMTDYLCLDTGIASLHKKLAEPLDIYSDVSVTHLEERNGSVIGCVTHCGESIKADHVIITAPPAQAAKILPNCWEKETNFLTSIEQPSAVTVTLFLNSSLEKNIWSYIYRPNPNKLVSFCVDASQKNPNMVASGKAILQAWICHPSADAILELDDDQVKVRVISELKNDFPNLPEMIDEIYVHRVSQAIPQMRIGHNARAKDFLNMIDKRPGIELCGDYLSGGYMECGLWSAQRAVDNILSNEL